MHTLTHGLTLHGSTDSEVSIINLKRLGAWHYKARKARSLVQEQQSSLPAKQIHENLKKYRQV